MGCDCLKPEEITKEIKKYNTITEKQDNYIIVKKLAIFLAFEPNNKYTKYT